MRRADIFPFDEPGEPGSEAEAEEGERAVEIAAGCGGVEGRRLCCEGREDNEQEEVCLRQHHGEFMGVFCWLLLACGGVVGVVGVIGVVVYLACTRVVWGSLAAVRGRDREVRPSSRGWPCNGDDGRRKRRRELQTSREERSTLSGIPVLVQRLDPCLPVAGSLAWQRRQGQRLGQRGELN